MSEGPTQRRPRSALRVRDFRLFWLALIAQVGGQMMFQFTLGWLAFDLTGSPAYLGMVHLSGFAPQIALTLLGGVLADRWDPRKLIAFAQSIGAATMSRISSSCACPYSFLRCSWSWAPMARRTSSSYCLLQ